MNEVDEENHRFPYSLVWTPIPLITYLFPFIGHMGIATSTGVIRDFAGPYFVSEDNMGFGWPTRYLKLDISKVDGGNDSWDESVAKASTCYTKRMHNLFCDNCHSHCAMALELMNYDNRAKWNMVQLSLWMFFSGKYVGFSGFLKTWIPFLIFLITCLLLWFLL
ncbi:unnamed protein product [Diamesa serratosioi]